MRILFLVAAGLLALAATAAPAADPAKPLKIIVPFPAGSGTDTGARVLGQWLSAKTGQAVIVDNRPGASGFIAAQAAAAAAPDGHTLLLTTNTTHAANPAMFKKLPYDPVKDFEITLRPAVCFPPTSPKHTDDTLSEFVRAALADPQVRQEFSRTGGRGRGSTPEELRAFVASEMAKWAAAVNTAGIQPE
jgi:tripartite-type tricarboxylate transporter receptor subunit TctC